MRVTGKAEGLVAIAACLALLGCPTAPVSTDAGPTVCGVGATDCAGTCVDVKVDDANCGACGRRCASTEGCAGGQCLPRNCSAASCGVDQVCANASVCQQRSCVGVTCADDETCVDGRCQTRACGQVACPPGAVCRNGACLDVACAGVSCTGGSVCLNGQCFPPACADTTCSAAQVCVGTTTCVERPCVGVTCPTGRVCVGGACQPEACGIPPCPMGQACVAGVCTDVGCRGVTCPASRVCVRGACVNPMMTAATPSSGFGSGSTLGASGMSNGTHQHQGILGDSTPPATPATQSNGSHTNLPGQISTVR